MPGSQLPAHVPFHVQSVPLRAPDVYGRVTQFLSPAWGHCIAMAESTEPQNLDREDTLIQAEPVPEVPTGKAKAKSKYGRKAGKASDKRADRTHRILEEQFSRAQRLSTEQDSIPSGASPREIHVPCTGAWSPVNTIQQVSDQTFGQAGPPMFGEDLDLPGPSSAPTAVLSPMAAGSRPSLEPSFSAQLQSWISQAVIQAVASSGIHQASPVPGPSSAPASSYRPPADRSGMVSPSHSPESESSNVSDYNEGGGPLV